MAPLDQASEALAQAIAARVAAELRENPAPPVRWLRPKDAARYVGMTLRALEQRRAQGLPPRFSRAGRLVTYDIQDLDQWLAEGK